MFSGGRRFVVAVGPAERTHVDQLVMMVLVVILFVLRGQLNGTSPAWRIRSLR